MTASESYKASRSEFMGAALFASAIGVICACLAILAILASTLSLTPEKNVARAFSAGTLSPDEYFDSDWSHSWRLQRDCEAIYMASAHDLHPIRFVFAPRLPKNSPGQDASMCTMLRDLSTDGIDHPYLRGTSAKTIPALRSALAISLSFIPPSALRAAWASSAGLALVLLLLRVSRVVPEQNKWPLMAALFAFSAAALALSGMSLSVAPAICALALGTAACLGAKSVELKSFVVSCAMGGAFGAVMMLSDYFSGALIAGLAALIFCRAASYGQARRAISQWVVGSYIIGAVLAFVLAVSASAIARDLSVEAATASVLNWFKTHLFLEPARAQAIFALAGRRVADLWSAAHGAGGAAVMLGLGLLICGPLWVAGEARTRNAWDATLLLVSALLIALLLWGVFNLRAIISRPQEYSLLAAVAAGTAAWIIASIFQALYRASKAVRLETRSEA